MYHIYILPALHIDILPVIYRIGILPAVYHVDISSISYK